MDNDTIQYYELHASDVATSYEAVESPLASLFPFLFRKGNSVLDIGIGSGRDIALLMKNGIDAFGLEPSSGLIDEAMRLHPNLAGRLQAGSLPQEFPESFTEKFDGVILSAVLMHIDDSELFGMDVDNQDDFMVEIGARINL